MDGKESRVELAYVRGSQISFIVLPDTLQRAPFFNRIKMWRKFRGHAQYGANTAAVNDGMAFGRGGGGGRGGGFGGRGGGGVVPFNKRPRIDGPGNNGGGMPAPPSGPPGGGGYGGNVYGGPMQQYGGGPQQQYGGNRYGPGPPPPQSGYGNGSYR